MERARHSSFLNQPRDHLLLLRDERIELRDFHAVVALLVASLNPATGSTQYYFHGATSVLAIDATRVYANCGVTSVCAFSLTDVLNPLAASTSSETFARMV